MNSILAHFTAIQSPVHHPMPGFNIIYNLILFNLLLPPSLSANPISCKNKTSGGTEIPYPFGLQGSGCGLPGFQMDCEDEERSVITIGSHNYTVLNVSTDSQSSTLVDNEYFQECTKTYDIFDQITDTTVFHIVQQQNFSLKVFKCNNRCVLDVGYFHYSCDFEFVTIVGVIAEWDITNNPLYQNCTSCHSSGGWCGYNISNSGQFLCFCGDATHSNQCPEGKKSPNRGTITGITTGTGALITIVTLFVVVTVYRKRSSSSKGIPTSVATEFMNSGSVGTVEKFLQSYIHQMPTRYSFSQLKKITNNFSDKLGGGGFGVVYKGKLRSGFLVAVKLLDQSRQSEKQFMNEVATLGTIHHFHLVRLMGYCFEAIRSALVYEYMPNGSLEKFIFLGKEEKQKLSWDKLYSIALGAARGIAYLHEDCSRRIIHFDIKPHNILLDEDFTAKVADFGLAKLSGQAEEQVSMTAGGRGTAGYAAPEVWSRNWGPVTDKSDVYSFGMLLLEITGRRRNIDLQVSRSSQLYFPAWAFKLIESGELEKNLRESGRGGMSVEDEEKVRRMAKVGLWCIQDNSIERPAMSRVVQMLEGNADDVGNPPIPFNSNPPNPPREASVSSPFEESSSMLHP